MRQDKLLELRELQLRRDRLPALSFRHSSPPKNRALPDSVASAEISGPRRLTAEFDRLQKPATSCADALAERVRQLGIMVSTVGPYRVRACTHLDVDAGGIARAVEAIAEVLR
jgi:hypothetical protein